MQHIYPQSLAAEELNKPTSGQAWRGISGSEEALRVAE